MPVLYKCKNLLCFRRAAPGGDGKCGPCNAMAERDEGPRTLLYPVFETDSKRGRALMKLLGWNLDEYGNKVGEVKVDSYSRQTPTPTKVRRHSRSRPKKKLTTYQHLLKRLRSLW